MLLLVVPVDQLDFVVQYNLFSFFQAIPSRDVPFLDLDPSFFGARFWAIPIILEE